MSLSNRQRKAQRKTSRAAPRKATNTATVVTLEPTRRKTGLEWLLSKKRITARKFQIGSAYGADFRTADSYGVAGLRSCLSDSVHGGGHGAPALTFAELDIVVAERLHAARQALGFHVEMTAVCDAICGKGFTPREINPDQREAAKIEQTLQIALDLMSHIYPLTFDLKRA